jgi:hypothetical protein
MPTRQTSIGDLDGVPIAVAGYPRMLDGFNERQCPSAPDPTP